MNWKLIALDLDGTLLGQGDHISEENAEWVRKAQASGLTVVLVSGRHQLRIAPILRALNMKTAIITTNGCEIWSAEGRLLHRSVLPWKDVEAVHLVSFQHHLLYRAYCAEGVFDSDRSLYLPQMDYSWLKMLLKSENRRSLSAALERLRAMKRLELVVYGSPDEPNQIDVQPKGTNKAAALSKLCESLGIRREEVIAFGDDRNDADMLRWAGMGVAMDNAPDDVKAAADAIAPHHLESGVGRTIARLLNNATA